MNVSIIEKIQKCCDCGAVFLSVYMALESVINRNYEAMGGWLCSAALSISAGLAHGDVRFWRKRYLDEFDKNKEHEGK